jgi:hypothetical protein
MPCAGSTATPSAGTFSSSKSGVRLKDRRPFALRISASAIGPLSHSPSASSRTRVCSCPAASALRTRRSFRSFLSRKLRGTFWIFVFIFPSVSIGRTATYSRIVITLLLFFVDSVATCRYSALRNETPSEPTEGPPELQAMPKGQRATGEVRGQEQPHADCDCGDGAV